MTEDRHKKKRKISSSFLPGEDLTQASCLIRVEGQFALEAPSWRKDRSLSTLIFLGTTSGMPSLLRVHSTRVQRQPQTNNVCQSGTWEAQHKVQPVQFFVKGKVGMSTTVVRGCLEEILSQVIGTDGLDV